MKTHGRYSSSKYRKTWKEEDKAAYDDAESVESERKVSDRDDPERDREDIKPD